MKPHLLAAVVLAALLPRCADAGDYFGHKLDGTTYDKYRQLILPAKDELRWQEIPWRLGFWRGLVEAQKADKPLLLWMYGGSPAGVC